MGSWVPQLQLGQSDSVRRVGSDSQSSIDLSCSRNRRATSRGRHRSLVIPSGYKEMRSGLVLRQVLILGFTAVAGLARVRVSLGSRSVATPATS